MTRNDFDFVVIGAGSGGVRAARIAAKHGARVALIESGRIGGTCVHAGCVPKKLLVYAAQHAQALRCASRYGLATSATQALPVDVHVGWTTLREAVQAETSRLGDLYQRALLDAGVTLLRGVGRLEGPVVAGSAVVRVGAEVLRARQVLIATGARPHVPAVSGSELGLVSDDIFTLPHLPERIVIVGGGYIGLELACVLVRLGVRVTIVHRGAELLKAFDCDVRAHIAKELPKLGIELRLSANVRALEASAGGRRVCLEDGTSLLADAVLFATGRVPRSESLGLQEAGVQLDDTGAVVVDEWSATSVPQIHAVGDVTGRVQLTPVALAEGHALADTLFGGKRRSAWSMLVPTAVFCEPEIACVGETEQAARARGAAVDIYRAVFRPLEHALDGSDSRALVKLVLDRASQRVLGVHLVGPHASESIQGFSAAISAGLTKAQLDESVGVHPSVAEELFTLRQPIGP